MRILFLYPNISLNLRINHGIAALSAFMKRHGHTTALLQFNTRRSLRNLTRIKQFKPDIIGISSCTNQWGVTKFLAEKIKSKFNIKIFVGGSHPTVYPECLFETTKIDGICRGESEFALLELVEKLSKGQSVSDTPNFWIRKEEEIIKNQIRSLVENLDDLPIPDWDLFDKKAIYEYPCFNFSRGCIYGCNYCINSTLRSLYKGKGTYVRMKSVNRAISEIKDKFKKYDLKVLNFDDDVFIKNKKWFSDFCSIYQKEISLPLNCNIRPENVDEATCAMLKKIGGRMVGMGIESGDPEIRNRILGRPMKNDNIIRAFKVVRDAGLKTYSFNMIGIPGETPESFKKTVKLNREILPDEAQLSIFYPFPRTPLGELCQKEGYIKYNSTYGFFHRSLLALPGFAQREIHRWFDKFEYLVYKDVNFIKACKFRISKFIYRRRLINFFCIPLLWGIKKLRSFKKFK